MSASPDNPAAGALEPLKNPVFRMLWLAWLAANISLWMHDVAAAWLMTTLTSDAALVALVATAGTLPMFLLGLPSGALADIVDRRRYFAGTQLWAAAIASLLVVLSLVGALSPPMLLLLTFLNGITMAMRWPVFAAIVPSVVPREQLPSALALNGAAMNVPRIVGPAIAGALLASAGSALVFGLNAVISVAAFVMILRWKSARKEGALPGERFVGAMRVGLQYLRQSPRLQVSMLRIGLFMLQVSGMMSLLPLLAKQMPGGGAGTFSALLAATGLGAVGMVVFLGRMRAHLGRDRAVLTGSLLHAAGAAGAALAPNLWVALPCLLFAGAAVILTANTITVAAQLTLPDWVRARGMAVYQMALMGGAAAGAAIWGHVAAGLEVRSTVLASAGFGVLVVVFTYRMSIDAVNPDDQRPMPVAAPPQPAITIDADDGPVMVTVEYQIDPARAPEFAAVMQLTRQARLRQGALSWGLFRDAHAPGRYVEYFVDETWLEHQRRLERFTAGDAGLRERRLAFHIGEQPPAVRRLVGETLVG